MHSCFANFAKTNTRLKTTARSPDATAATRVVGLRNPDASAKSLSVLIGIGIILLGVSYLLALCGIKMLNNEMDKVRRAIGADRQ